MQVIKSPYIGIETTNGITVLYTATGDYSVFIEIENPIMEYCCDIDAYYDFHQIFSNIIKTLDAGYILQKQDIYSKKKFTYPIENTPDADHLNLRYFDYFKDREYFTLKTYLIITQQIKKSSFFQYDASKWKDFITKIQKVLDLLVNKGIDTKLLNESEVTNYLYRYTAFNFSDDKFSLDNIKASDEYLKIGSKKCKCLSLIDIDEVDTPVQIKPFMYDNSGVNYPKDLFSFLKTVPETECVIYNQVISIPTQRLELNKLEAKKKRHSSIPDPANDLCVQDISLVLSEIAKENKLLVYCHYDLLLISKGDIDKAVNYIETNLFDIGIVPSKQTYNQLEIYLASIPGNSVNLKNYELFLTTSDAAICLLNKERLLTSELTPFKTFFTNRAGIPICIDISGKEGNKRFTDNSSKFILGPSGSGKSFTVNGIIRQYINENTDVVMVDTGHSYSGICSYYNGKYITYSEDDPITMNPFRIEKEEFNTEKIDFLKSLIFLLWKGAEGEASTVEDTLIGLVINGYYMDYFSNGRDKKYLSFNSFYEYSIVEIPNICKEKGITFSINEYKFIMERFYKGGAYEKTLNDDFDSSLFNQRFIVFEIDSIKENKVLFPIVTLIIMDVFLQKMRHKKNRKALIIEEAWKAIASPVMANYIQYLYKTVRKFWGEIIVVTQELEDIIGNKIVKNTIINNADTLILLDQSKFKNRYAEISNLLGLSEVEQKKIWTINNLNNKDNRGAFKEIYIKRGQYGLVLGVEEPPHCYMCYTTERKEKDALGIYEKHYNDYGIALDAFVGDMKKSGKSPLAFSTLINDQNFILQ